MNLPRFGVRNPVPVNLLMLAIFFAGGVSGLQLRRAFFPEIEPEAILLNAPYPGADPQEVEETLVIKIEDALRNLDEVDEISASVFEGGSGVTVDLREGQDPELALDEVERRIDALQDLPDEAEEIVVQLLESKLPVIQVAVFGDLPEDELKEAIRDLRDELRELPDMGEILIGGVRNEELRIEVDQDALLTYGLSLPEIGQRVGAWMREVPGGTVRGSLGNTRVRAMGYEEASEAVRNMPVITNDDGSVIRLEEIADIREGYIDDQVLSRFNNKPSATLTVFKVGNQDIVKMAKRVRAYVQGRNNEPLAFGINDRVSSFLGRDSMRLSAWKLGRETTASRPDGLQVAAFSDLARFVEGRLSLLLRNAGFGAILVFGTLLLVLNWRAALWVGVGLVTALLGTLVIMAWADITLNLLTMFGLIVVIGLLVDDAIVVAENIQARHEAGLPPLEAAEIGAGQVAWPVVATVLTSIVAFMPLTFIKGSIGDLLGALPLVVAAALLMSLIETLLILPSHMAHTLVRHDRAIERAKEASEDGKPSLHVIARYEAWRDRMLLEKLIPTFGRVLDRLLRWRYMTITVAIAALILTFGLVAGKRVIFEFLSNSDSETIIIDMEMPVGTNIQRTNAQAAIIEQVAAALPEVNSISTQVGQTTNIDTGQAESAATHVVQMFLELLPTEARDRESTAVIADIREGIKGKLDEVERVAFSEIQGGPSGPALQLRVAGEPDAIARAVNDLKRELGRIEGVVDIRDNSAQGLPEIRWRVTPSGAALGFSNADVAQQIRGYLFGIDAHVFAENEEDIDVRVRVDDETRQSLFELENAWLISPAGTPVPLSEVAEREESTTYATIRRIDSQRAITVLADVTPGISPEQVTGRLNNPPKADGDKTGEDPSIDGNIGTLSPLDELRARHPDVTIEYGGRQEQMADAFSSLPIGFMAAAVMIYVILAWLFASYFQPLVVMICIPFAMIGMIWGHFFLGYNMTFLSLIGFVALSGIVVNDSLILVEFFNERRRQGESVHNALVSAGRGRLRAILLTTVTTVLGLLPLILEQSFQAKFLIPMGITIAGGLISATFVILIVVPCVMMVLHDLKRLIHFMWFGRPLDEAALSEKLRKAAEH